MKRVIALALVMFGLSSFTVGRNVTGTSQAKDRKQSPPAASASPTSLDFGDQVLQTISKQSRVTLINNTDASIKVNRVDMDVKGDDFVFDFDDEDCTGEAIEPGKSCSIPVFFFPLVAGERRSFLLITYDDPDHPQKISLRGNGIKPR